MSLSVGIDEVHLVKNVKSENVDMKIRVVRKACMQRPGLSAVLIFRDSSARTAAE